VPPDDTTALKHLLIITPGFPADEDDTDCLPAVQQFILSHRHVYSDVKISIIALHYPADRKEYAWNGHDVYALANDNKGGIHKLLSFFRINRIVKQIQKQFPVDGILCFWLSDTALVAKLFAKKLGVPYLIWMHGQDAKAGNKYVQLVNPGMERLAAISEQQRNIFTNAYGQTPAHLIHNGINEAVFPPFNEHERAIGLLAVGSLILLKQYHLFIELVEYLKNSGFNAIKTMLVGEGPLENKLKQEINARGLEDNIILTGKIPHNEVLRLMNDAKIFIHPSSYEGHSTVMLEALYSGCKLVSFLPVGTGVVPNHTVCTGIEQMKEVCLDLLSNAQPHTRVKFADMKDSVKQVHGILNAM
jgi:glycosyltransferase involved in cell wall biosynthesis